mmetsp:Transcript_8851/g.23469  ORF Transcript_8851/g.23469 Transcript_8851/m.23469 type:complete len:228 (+) Transcript_8851:847-1530(+)
MLIEQRLLVRKVLLVRLKQPTQRRDDLAAPRVDAGRLREPAEQRELGLALGMLVVEHGHLDRRHVDCPTGSRRSRLRLALVRQQRDVLALDRDWRRLALDLHLEPPVGRLREHTPALAVEVGTRAQPGDDHLLHIHVRAEPNRRAGAADRSIHTTRRHLRRRLGGDERCQERLDVAERLLLDLQVGGARFADHRVRAVDDDQAVAPELAPRWHIVLVRPSVEAMLEL